MPGIRTYIAVDGGMSDNIRPALYGAKYTAVSANRMNEPHDEKVTIAGKCCESGDKLIEEAYLAHPTEGDIIAVFCTGAYGYSMASNYNRLPKPAVVFCENGEHQLVVRRETYEDVVRLDIPLQTSKTGGEDLKKRNILLFFIYRSCSNYVGSGILVLRHANYRSAIKETSLSLETRS